MAALSLVCRQCNTQLKSVAEAQSHGEATGHSQFEESTEKVTNLVCTACGKPCRTQTEQDLHSRRNPGHDTFVDKTEEGTAVINTEVEMKEVSASLAEEAGVQLPPKKEQPPGDAEEGPLELAPPAALQVPAAVHLKHRQALEDMGFSANKATRALHFSGNSSLEAAVEWLEKHSGDPDVDEPLLVPQAPPPKAALSGEDARRQAEDLFRKAKERREKEEKDLEKVREQERIRMGKEMAQVRRVEEEQKLRRNLQERKREKAEEARARERIRQKLDEDRRERRRKLGLPEEPSEEERAAEAAKAAEKEKEREAKQARGYVAPKPVTLLANVRQQLVAMKKTYTPAEDERLKTCWQTLLKYIGNVARAPDEEKFRRIKLGNAAYQARVGGVVGAQQLLETLGFEPEAGGEALYLPPEQVSVELLTAVGGEIDSAISNPFFGAL